MNKIELTREELTNILQVATGNVKDFVMDNDKFIDKQLKAINYTHCCKSDSEQLFAFLFWYRKYSGKFYTVKKTVENYLKYKSK